MTATSLSKAGPTRGEEVEEVKEVEEVEERDLRSRRFVSLRLGLREAMECPEFNVSGEEGFDKKKWGVVSKKRRSKDRPLHRRREFGMNCHASGGTRFSWITP